MALFRRTMGTNSGEGTVGARCDTLESTRLLPYVFEVTPTEQLPRDCYELVQPRE